MPRKTEILDHLRIFLWKFCLWRILIKFLVRNKSADSALGRCLPNPYQFAIGHLQETKSYGLTWLLELRQLLEWNMYFQLSESAHKFLISQVKRNSIVLDIGANFGSTTLLLAQKVGQGGHVYSFEPFPENFKKLSTNVDLNRLNNIDIFNIGLSRNEQILEMSLPSHQHAAQAKVKTQGDIQGIAVPFTTVDKFVKEQKLPRVDFLKIDVEGYEYRVLLGAKDTLLAHKPDLYFEFNPQLITHQKDNPRELINFLHSMNYKLYLAPNMTEVSGSEDFQNWHYDILAKYFLTP